MQLPKETKVDAPSLIGRVRQFLAEGLLARFEQASAVVPCLAKDGCVVLVAGNLPGAATPDDRHARIDLLRVLARAVLAECEGSDVRAVVVANDRSPPRSPTSPSAGATRPAGRRPRWPPCPGTSTTPTGNANT